MARPSSTLDLPLYADLSFLAQRRRGLLRRAHASTPQARRLPIRRRSESRHQSLRRRDKRRSKTLRLDRRSPPRPRRCETRETSVRVDPLGYSRWASWPRCYVAGLFDMPNTEPPVPALVPVADWSRVRILLDGEPWLAREGEVLLGTRKLDMRRALLLSAWTHRTPAGITVAGRELRLLSLADRAVGMQLLQLSLDRDGVDVRLEASFAMAGLGMEPVRLDQDLGAWRTEGTRKGVAMTGTATLRLGHEVLAPDRPFSLRWAGAPCWPRTRLPGTRAGPPATC